MMLASSLRYLLFHASPKGLLKPTLRQPNGRQGDLGFTINGALGTLHTPSRHYNNSSNTWLTVVPHTQPPGKAANTVGATIAASPSPVTAARQAAAAILADARQREAASLDVASQHGASCARCWAVEAEARGRALAQSRSEARQARAGRELRSPGEEILRRRAGIRPVQTSRWSYGGTRSRRQDTKGVTVDPPPPRGWQQAGMEEVRCPAQCSGHGKCVAFCECDHGWGGLGCWEEVPSVPRDQRIAVLMVRALHCQACAAPS